MTLPDTPPPVTLPDTPPPVAPPDTPPPVAPPTERHPGTPRPTRPVLLAAAAVGAVSLGTGPVLSLLDVATSAQSAAWARIAADIATSATAAIMLLLTSLRRSGSDRRVWCLMAVGAGAWSVGSVLWATYLPNGGELSSPGPADLFFVVLPLSWCAAAIIRSQQTGEERSSRVVRRLDLIDSVTIALSSLLVLWVFAYRVTRVEVDDASMLLSMLYPVLGMVVLALLVRSIGRNPSDRRALILLCVGVASCVVGDAAYLLVTHSLAITPAVPTIVDTAWIVGFTFIAGAAWIAEPGPERTPRPTKARRHVLLPASLGGVAAVVALVDLTETGGATWTMSTLVLIMVLLMVRQSITLSENRRLSRELVGSLKGLEHQASHDALTGLANREHLTDRLLALIATAGSGDRCSAVLFLDIDLLKPVNDSLGHAKGDELIRTVAARLTDRCGSSVVRFGGDEFVVLLAHAGSPADIEAEANRLARDMHEPFVTGGTTLVPSVSVGVAIVEAGAVPDEVLRRADTALYQAKAAGRGTAAMFETSMDDANLRRARIAPDLRLALEEDQFELHFQPVIELATGRVGKVESLLRWHHPEEGLLAPDRFLAQAEALGLLCEIGRRSLLTATALFAEVNRRDPAHPVRVTVNLSATELGSEVVRNVSDALAASGLDPAMLILEITEDVIIDDSVRRTLNELTALGVELAIDDFGTGNSSLRQLGDYPASILKIDRSNVAGIDHPDDRFIVQAMIELAQQLGLSTVGEGVETLEQARLLHELGCVHGQGWLFDRALPFEQLDARWLRGDASTHLALRRLGRGEPVGDPLRNERRGRSGTTV